MKKKFLAILISLLMSAAFLSATVISAGAEDLTTIYIEKSAGETQVYPAEMPTGDYIRVRALLIGDDGLLADAVEGVALASCTVSLSLDNDTDDGITDITVANSPAETPPSGLTFISLTAYNALNVAPTGGYVEFAVSADDVRTTGTVVLTVTIDNGADPVETANISFEIAAPVANGYVVRTGAVTAAGSSVYPKSMKMPLVGEEVPAATGNYYTGIPLTPEKDQIVNVFAVYDTGSELIFTDNLPEGADSVTIKANSALVEDETGDIFVIDSALASLTDGYVSVTWHVEDLKLVELMSQHLDAVMSYAGEDAGLAQYEVLDDIFDEGMELNWTATSAVTREVGPVAGDTVNSGSDGVIVSPETIIGTIEGDTSWNGVGALVDIMMVGLPLNIVVDGLTGSGGQAAAVASDGVVENGESEGPGLMNLSNPISPLDAFLLLDDPTVQPATFEVVCETGDFIYGALLGWDAYDNPAPVARNGSASFELNEGNLKMWDLDEPGYDSYGNWASVYFTNQSFVPFAIRNDVPGQISQVYVTDVDGAEYDLVSCVDGNGVGFVGTVDADQVTLTLDYSDPTAGAFNGVIGVDAAFDNQTYSIEKAVVTEAGTISALSIEAADPVLYGTNSQTAFDVNSAITGNSRALFVLEGENGALMITTTAITQTITAGDLAEIELLYPDLTANVVVGHLNDNDLIRFNNMYKAYDEFGNEVAWDLVDVEDLAAETTGTSWALATAADSVVIDGATLTMNYDIDLLGVPSGGEGSFQLEALSGTPVGDSITANVRVVRTAEFAPVLTAESQLPVPVMVYLADQDGNRVAPPDQTTYEVDIKSDNATGNQIEDQDEGPANEVTVEIESIYAGEVILVDAAASLGRDGIVGLISQGDGILGFTYYDLQLESDYDYQKPVVTKVKDGPCQIIISISDNNGVDIAATIETIELLDEDLDAVLNGLDNATLFSGVDNGTGAIITIDVSEIIAPDEDPQGAYQLTVQAIDLQGNEADELVKLVDVDVCLVPPPVCVSVSPTYMVAGTTETIVITAVNTSFDGSETVTACTGVTVGTVTATSATQLSVQLTAADDASGTCGLAVELADEEILSCAAFEIQEVTCELTAAPATLRSGWLIPRLTLVTITGSEDCDPFTFANSAVTADERLIPLLSIPVFNTILVPTLIWPGTADATVTLTVGGENTTTVEVVAGVLP